MNRLDSKVKMCVVLHGKRNGPHEPQEIHRLFAEGQLRKEDLAWKSGMQDWQPLDVVCPELFKADAATASNVSAAEPVLKEHPK